MHNGIFIHLLKTGENYIVVPLGCNFTIPWKGAFIKIIDLWEGFAENKFW